jgi:hypothetical protein
MALGFTKSSGGSADFLPIIKFDARAGRIFRVDREDGVSTPHDITRNFRAVFDFENVEMGYINFDTGSAPDFQMMPMEEWAENKPKPPSDKHREGFRMRVRLSKECGGDLRELSGTSAALREGIDSLHDDYMSGLSKNAGKLPVVSLEDTVGRESGGKNGIKSTNYQPVFKIVSWVDRPKDMERKAAPQKEERSAPSTGSTRAKPPIMDDDEDFGN